jgi:aspartyl protease family protein
MGLQDRDYYREKYKKEQQASGVLANKKSKKTGIKYLLYPLITMVALWYGADKLLDKTNTISISTIIGKEKSPDLLAGGIILKTDRQGHFRGTVLINNVPMPFLIDTGATKTSIPAKMAAIAKLPLGSPIESNTAGGQVIDHLTQINSLKIGNAEIRNLNANINQYLDEVLIGMNTLKYFQMTQKGNTLTLIANNNPSSAQAFNQTDNKIPIDTQTSDKPVKIKKSISCDENKSCKTIYSNR